jgi:Putative transposase/Transposase zinc-binding domain
MLPLPTGREASAGVAASRYERHRPERTLLYQLVEDYYPALKTHLAAQGATLPGYVEREFEAYLKCGRLEHGFLRVRCETCHAEQLLGFSCKRRGFCPSCGARRMAESAALLVDEVFPAQPVRQWVLSFPYPLRFLFASRPAIMSKVLGIVYRCIATHLIKKAGFSCTTARTGAVTLIQRFGSALNLNVHFHILFLDGVYADSATGSSLRFRWVSGIAVGPHAGRKVFTLQTLPDCSEPFVDDVGKVAGFSLHAGVAARAHEREKLERLCRYIARPAVSEKRLSLLSNGKVRYELKTPYRDGTTHVIFEPLDFIARLVALVPKPRVNLTRFHGVFAPNSAHRAQVTPAKRGKGNKARMADAVEDTTPAERRAAMTWAQRLKRVFNIDIETCNSCGGPVKIIACIRLQGCRR